MSILTTVLWVALSWQTVYQQIMYIDVIGIRLDKSLAIRAFMTRA